jgi:hypothetical protein
LAAAFFLAAHLFFMLSDAALRWAALKVRHASLVQGLARKIPGRWRSGAVGYGAWLDRVELQWPV